MPKASVWPHMAQRLTLHGITLKVFHGCCWRTCYRWNPNNRSSVNEYLIFISLRTSEIHLFYNLLLFYWHFLEILWMFIFLVLYFSFSPSFSTTAQLLHEFLILRFVSLNLESQEEKHMKAEAKENAAQDETAVCYSLNTASCQISYLCSKRINISPTSVSNKTSWKVDQGLANQILMETASLN